MFGLSAPSQLLTTFGQTFRVERDSKVTTVKGKAVKGPPIVFDIRGNVQPMSGMELLNVPEGDRYRETYWLYTDELAKALAISDRVVFQGASYEVKKLETWGEAPNGYQRAMIMRIDVGPKTSNVRTTR